MEKKISFFSTDMYAYFLLIVTVFFWGLSWPIGRWIVSTDYGLTIPPFMIASIRYVLVVLLFIPITYLFDRKIDFTFFKIFKKDLLLMAFLSITLYQFGYLYGEVYTASSDASLVVATSPIWVMFISFFLIKEPITKLKILGSLIAFLGVVLIVGFSPNVHVPDRFLGDLLVFIAAFAYASYTVLLRRLFNNLPLKYDKKVSSFQIIMWISIIGLILTFPLSIFIYPEYLDINLYFIIPDRIWIGILYLAVLSTVIAYITYTEAVKRIGAGRSVIFVNLVPVVGIAASTFIGEKIDPLVHLTSFILIFIGIRLVNLKIKPKIVNDSVQIKASVETFTD